MNKMLLAVMVTSFAVAQAQPPAGRPGMGFGGGMHMMGLEGGHPGTVVAGAPFSAQEVTTETQTLANGTHIQHTLTATVYRDAQGRTRTERTFTEPSGATKTMVSIFDPVASVGYNLNPAALTGTKFTLHTPNAANEARWEAREQHVKSSQQVVTTDLGTQTIAGLTATGTQTTRTIPAGAMGNDQAITVSSTKWVSPDLQITVQMTRTDPRSGDVSFQVQNLNRNAPDASLFQAPANYTITARTGHGPVAAASGSVAQ